MRVQSHRAVHGRATNIPPISSLLLPPAPPSRLLPLLSFLLLLLCEAAPLSIVGGAAAGASDSTKVTDPVQRGQLTPLRRILASAAPGAGNASSSEVPSAEDSAALASKPGPSASTAEVPTAGNSSAGANSAKNSAAGDSRSVASSAGRPAGNGASSPWPAPPIPDEIRSGKNSAWAPPEKVDSSEFSNASGIAPTPTTADPPALPGPPFAASVSKQERTEENRDPREKGAGAGTTIADSGSESEPAEHGRGSFPERVQFPVKPHAVESLKRRFPKFIFVYDLGTGFTTELLKFIPKWWADSYAGEEYLFHLFAEHGIARTTDPTQASLFYIPFLLSRFLMMKRATGMLSQDSIHEASRLFQGSVLKRVRTFFPWFNRTDGRDHFTVIAADHGRCSLLPFVTDPSVYGSMFFLQYNGDLLVRSNHFDERKQMHTLSYNPGRGKARNVPELPCYLPDADVIIPPFVDPSIPIVAPQSSKRDISALFAFGKYYAREEAQAVFFNHPIRIELYSLFEELQVPGWSFGPRPRNETIRDMAHSLFCVTPPGHSQWTVRTSLAILHGCIPVTFTREHHSAFQDSLDYSTFSLNVDPDDLPLLKRRIDKVRQNKGKLMSMQGALKSAQIAMSWDPVFLNGAIARLLSELQKKACQILDGRTVGSLTCLSSQT